MYSKPFDGSIWTPSRYSNVDAIFDDTDDIIFSLFKYQNFSIALVRVRFRICSGLVWVGSVIVISIQKSFFEIIPDINRVELLFEHLHSSYYEHQLYRFMPFACYMCDS